MLGILVGSTNAFEIAAETILMMISLITSWGRMTLLGVLCVVYSPLANTAPPNVLVIMIDDLNGWVGCLDGHPQVRTPHIDALAERGVLFTNAHVQATFCGPSRVSMLSGRYPQTTGCYDFERYSELASLREHPPLPMQFRRHGYRTFGGGKVFHHGMGSGWVAESWDTDWKTPSNPRPRERMNWPVPIWDWGPFLDDDEAMGDYQLARVTRETLQQTHEQPLMMIAGIRRPHVPLHVPKKWFDLYPLEEIVLPEVLENDLDDVPHPEIALEGHAAPVHAEIVEKDLWHSLVQAYLASISFVDHCVGEMLAGLDAGPNRDNTIVVLVSDHGFHLGEKQHWAKRTLWEETTRIPMIIMGPGLPAGSKVSKPVGAIDLYPTLCDLAGVAPPSGLEGHSLKALLKDAHAKWSHPAVTTFEPGDLAIRTERWRYIIYPDQTKELYDHQRDPREWHNLAGKSEYEAVEKELAAKGRQVIGGR